ncbi:hypothetical protein CAOG_03761 [Capsaspora owczarzaki ATCC 30864]|nr:hypothetical protein CAOG_03761 [Capsaspora owczarzaki ATCC 30864]|eukprot:XP_004363489.1 hypothetical protein CAOG_03761 [Capsaspora owczarzaki ATCC 30864]
MSQTIARARALYEFQAASDVELALQPGDIILITRMDVGGGWWEGRVAGEDTPLGLFPEHYVELIPQPTPAPVSGPPKLPARNPPPRGLPAPSSPPATSESYDYEADIDAADGEADPDAEYPEASNDGPDDVEDEADDYPPVPPADYTRPSGDEYEDDDDEGSDSGYSFSNQAMSTSPGAVGRKSSFRVGSPTQEKPYRIIEGPRWEHTSWPVTVMVSKPEKKSKYSGMKQFTSYNVTSSSMKTSVSRRYKHFNWLHNRLGETFPNVSIPPMPEKVLQANFKFDEHFIEKRRRGLERFLNRVAAHPVLGTSNVFLHFLTAAEKANWKSGKRSAEKEAGRSSFIETMECPQNNVPDNRVMIVERFAKMAKAMEKSVTYLSYTTEHFQNKRAEFRSEYGKLSFALRRVVLHEKEASGPSSQPAPVDPVSGAPTSENLWCWRDDCEACAPLIKGMEMMSIGVGKISSTMDLQRQNDTVPLMEFLKDYTGILKTFPSLIKAHENAVDAYNQALLKEKESGDTISQLKNKCEAISNVTLAEFEHFHSMRLQDFKDMMDSFIQEQVFFHKKVAAMWEEMLPYFGAVETTDRV